ncbi:type I-C CRISPR-associated endonuclease Cas1 [bacterium]|nr:type I-C CRISPR-associated endonuclease Cas1 [bacterium]
MAAYGNTIYLTTPDTYASLEGETVLISMEEQKKVQVPFHHVSSIVCLESVRLSGPLQVRCAERGVSITWLNWSGRFGARVEGPTTGNVLLRLAQYDAYRDPGRSLELARQFVLGKIRNARSSALRVARECPSEDEQQQLQTSAQRMRRAQESAEYCRQVDILRGHEGEAAAEYFSTFGLHLRSGARRNFQFRKRQRRPAPDPINACLSFAYALLTTDCRGALESVGLDPQVGYLHQVRPGRPALALDLMEEFRAPLADRLVLTLINRGELSVGQFEYRPGGQVEMDASARKILIRAYQERKRTEIEYPLLNRKVQIGSLPYLQARLIARTLRGELESYLPFRNR